MAGFKRRRFAPVSGGVAGYIVHTISCRISWSNFFRCGLFQHRGTQKKRGVYFRTEKKGAYLRTRTQTHPPPQKKKKWREKGHQLLGGLAVTPGSHFLRLESEAPRARGRACESGRLQWRRTATALIPIQKRHYFFWI